MMTDDDGDDDDGGVNYNNLATVCLGKRVGAALSSS